MVFDPRAISKPAYESLASLRSQYNHALESNQIGEEVYKSRLQEQKGQALELYTYIATWGLMRLKGEEIALDKWDAQNLRIEHRASKSQEGKRAVIECFFECLQGLSRDQNFVLAHEAGLTTLKDIANPSVYLGLTGLALKLAQEFSFWADAVYHDIRGGEEQNGL